MTNVAEDRIPEPSERELWQTWGANVRARRSQLRLSQEALAAEIGATQGTVSSIERGLYGGSDGTRLAIARALGVEVHDLFTYPSTAQAS